MGLGFIGGGARGVKRSAPREQAARNPKPVREQANRTDAPEVRVTDAPEVRVTDAPEVRVPDAPEVRVPDAPEVRVTDAPEVRVTDAPEVRVTDAPDAADTTDAVAAGADEAVAAGADEAVAAGADDLHGIGRRVAALEQRIEQLLGPCEIQSPRSPIIDPIANEATRMAVSPPGEPMSPLDEPTASPASAALAAALAKPVAMASVERPSTRTPPPVMRQMAYGGAGTLKSDMAQEIAQAVLARRARLDYDDQ
jgi:hypothetical protein